MRGMVSIGIWSSAADNNQPYHRHAMEPYSIGHDHLENSRRLRKKEDPRKFGHHNNTNFETEWDRVRQDCVLFDLHGFGEAELL
jgi:hypothetical protein